jgi:hypothetical protein
MKEVICIVLSSEQNPEECDATDDDSSTTAGYIKFLFTQLTAFAVTDPKLTFAPL